MLNNLLYVTGILMTGFTLNYHIFWTLRAMNFISNLQEEGKRKDIPDFMSEMHIVSYTNISEMGMGLYNQCIWTFTTNVISKFNHQPFVFLNGIQ